MRRRSWSLLVLLAVGCGARSGIDTPPPCATVDDCAIVPFCGPVPACLDGFCALGEVRVCDDGSACTEDRCDEAARACVSAIRDRDRDGFGDASCGGDDCDDEDPRVSPGAAELCSGGVDDDCDERTDCSDLDCADDPVCEGCAPEGCVDGLDDDCDGLVDCADSDCATDLECCRPGEVRCADARDDDCDGLVDCLDDECARDPRCCIATDEVCNGLDDDCDGVPDDGVGCYFLDGEPIAAIATTTCGRAWYSYGDPDTASANPAPDVRRADEVVLLVQHGPCGANEAVIADATNDGDGGRLTAQLSITPRTAGGIVQSDEAGPRPECSYDARSGRGSCDWGWEPCCTDGVLLGEMTEDFCVEVTLTRPEGVRRVFVLDGADTPIERSFGEPIEICGQLAPAVP